MILQYKKTVEKVIVLVDDNENTNSVIQRRVWPTFVGWPCHSFSPAVNDFLVVYSTVTEMMHNLMRRLYYQIPCYQASETHGSARQAQQRALVELELRAACSLLQAAPICPSAQVGRD